MEAATAHLSLGNACLTTVYAPTSTRQERISSPRLPLPSPNFFLIIILGLRRLSLSISACNLVAYLLARVLFGQDRANASGFTCIAASSIDALFCSWGQLTNIHPSLSNIAVMPTHRRCLDPSPLISCHSFWRPTPTLR